HVASGEHFGLATLAPPPAVQLDGYAALRDRVGGSWFVDARDRLVGPEGHVEERRTRPFASAWLRFRRGRPWFQVRAAGRVPAPDASREFEAFVPHTVWNPGTSVVRVEAGVGRGDPTGGANLKPRQTATRQQRAGREAECPAGN